MNVRLLLAGLLVFAMTGCGGERSVHTTPEVRAAERQAAFLKGQLTELARLVERLETAVRAGDPDWCGDDLDAVRTREDSTAGALAAEIRALTLPEFEDAIANAGSPPDLERLLERANRRLADLSARTERGASAAGDLCGN